jgi:hypothetical protein
MLLLDAAHRRVHGKSVLATVASAALWWLARRIKTERPGALLRVALGGMIVVQAAAFICPLVSIGLDREGFAIRTGAAEVADLARVRDALPPGVVVATNHRDLHRAGLTRPWQFDYEILLEHPVYVEGTFYAGGTAELAGRANENRRLFETTDSSEARSIVERHGIRALVLEPGSTLALSPPPPWLEPVRGLRAISAYLVRSE